MSEPKSKAQLVAATDIIGHLRGRKGFGDWWHDIHTEDQQDIIDSLAAIITKHLSDGEDRQWMDSPTNL